MLGYMHAVTVHGGDIFRCIMNLMQIDWLHSDDDLWHEVYRLLSNNLSVTELIESSNLAIGHLVQYAERHSATLVYRWSRHVWHNPHCWTCAVILAKSSFICLAQKSLKAYEGKASEKRILQYLDNGFFVQWVPPTATRPSGPDPAS